MNHATSDYATWLPRLEFQPHLIAECIKKSLISVTEFGDFLINFAYQMRLESATSESGWSNQNYRHRTSECGRRIHGFITCNASSYYAFWLPMLEFHPNFIAEYIKKSYESVYVLHDF